MNKIIRKGLSILNVENPQKGTLLANSILSKTVDKETVVFLSGGSTPKLLYELIAKKGRLSFGAVAMVDERFGKRMHENSNEKMIKDTGLLRYFKNKDIPFYSVSEVTPVAISIKTRDGRHTKRYIEENGEDEGGIEKTSLAYSKTVKELLAKYEKSLAIMGIGENGHIAGLSAGVKSEKLKVKSYVAWVSDFPGDFKERITLTFNALSQMDLLIVLAFGKSKKKALRKMFEKGFFEEIPARFYTLPEIAKKTILITDQKI